MIPVQQAIDHVLALMAPLGTETVALRQALGRVLAVPAAAARNQPPFAASSMDGYAVKNAEIAPGARFTVIGESAAGNRFPDRLGSGEAVRIFTGAPVPDGADRVVIQEDVTADKNVITINERLDPKHYIRPQGDDFSTGFSVEAPRRLGPDDIALLAAMNQPEVTVYHRPEVAIISTGDELVMPGDDPGPDQIISSNALGLVALLEQNGARTRLLPIARDTTASLLQAFKLTAGADLIVTIGGASVGDHDIVHDVASDLGLDTAFYKVAMRPGKPLMAGRLAGTPMIGLPGNPVSAMVCGHVFLRPALDALQGLPAAPLPRERLPLAAPMGPNGPREHYMRAHLANVGGQTSVTPFERQDSALLSVLNRSNALLVRAPNDPARAMQDMVEIIRL